MLELAEYTKLFVGLFAVVNPLGAVPLFITMTAGESARQRRTTIIRVAESLVVILVVSLVLGEQILDFFGISIDSFRVGGGILVLLMAIAMLHAKTSPIRQTDEEADESVDRTSVAIVPLAMPLLAGPGAISTVILAAHKGSGIGHYAIVAVGILALGAAVWAVLQLSPWITRRISATGINVFTRIMGLILSAIAVEFIANGIRGLFPALGPA